MGTGSAPEAIITYIYPCDNDPAYPVEMQQSNSINECGFNNGVHQRNQGKSFISQTQLFKHLYKSNKIE